MSEPTKVKLLTPNFETLQRAFDNGDAGLVECQDSRTGETCAIICAFQQNDAGEIEMIPFARMIEGNPFEQYNPPNPDGGFHDQDA